MRSVVVVVVVVVMRLVLVLSSYMLAERLTASGLIGRKRLAP